ncbi:hypothetical protein Lesp02_00150 [Lentzea sp. NBRC 105346]|uniref:aminotransferase-like domain-containing protein n=1 Tax=Lentzea sp. NBRC 105346 TaxID=3032205 RepID=UPI0024A17B2D|nr:PLP-dependent aminotransferase family protein [Lentzea sp. NBRC 105346]GLZ27825.1 hypothetical protein Lesp02_00150 [Lentzea sp. NBRC 105346]
MNLDDPVLQSLNFLNEVVDRYPKSISFAPGAPHERFFAGISVARYIDRYCDHLRGKGFTDSEVRRRLYQYGPSRGLINDLIANALRCDEGIEVGPESIVVTVGCQEALFVTLRALGCDAVGIVDPSYVGVAGAARVLGIDIVPVRDLTRLDGFPVLYVAPDFANPTGNRMSLAARQRLLADARRRGVILLEDNAYGFTAADHLPPLKALDTSGQVIHFGTFAKTCFPGARVGFVVADQPGLADAIATVKSMVTVNTSALSQAVIGGMLLEHGGSINAMARGKAVLYRRNLRMLLDAMDRHLTGLPITWNRPAGGFFVVATLPVPVTDELLEHCADSFGVIWTPMRHFHLGGGGTHALRLACSYLDPEDIEEGVIRLARFVEAL